MTDQRHNHPQREELFQAVSTFVHDTDSALIVHCPDSRAEVTFMAGDNAGRIVVPFPKEQLRQQAADQAGFSVASRTAINPFTQEKIEIRHLFADFSEADAGVEWCLSAVQDVYGVGDAWLWITDKGYDDWPAPLPKPDVWPSR